MSLAQKNAPKPVVKNREITQVEDLQVNNGTVTRHTLTETLFSKKGGVVAVATIDLTDEKKAVTSVRANSYVPSSEDGLADLAAFYVHVAAAFGAIERGTLFLSKEGVLNPALETASE